MVNFTCTFRECLKFCRASLGYHYDWTSRKYYENVKSRFPPDLADLCQAIARSVGTNLTAEAAIVNYYPYGSSMGGHLDDAELTMQNPIVRIYLYYIIVTF
jgi:alkylated DNA repair protein alkB family protein 1